MGKGLAPKSREYYIKSKFEKDNKRGYTHVKHNNLYTIKSGYLSKPNYVSVKKQKAGD